MLIGVLVEIPDIAVEAIDVDLRHARPYPTGERGLLVLPKIKVVRLAELLEKSSEAAGGRGQGGLCLDAVVVAVHVWSPGTPRTRLTMAGPMSSSGRDTSTHRVALAACGMPL